MSSLLSVIIPIYNTNKYLAKCIDSVINQSYTNLEIILIDDGSTDNSLEICNKYKEIDPRIHVIHKVNGGLSDARNTGVSACKGDYLIFLDSDDYWLKDDFIEKAIPKNDEDVAFFGHSILVDSIIKEDNFVYSLNNYYPNGCSFVEDILEKNHVFYWYAWRYIIKTSLWKNNDISFPVGEKYEDSATMYKPLLLANKVLVYKDNCYCYVIRSDSISNVPKLDSYIDHLNVIKKAIVNISEEIGVNSRIKEALYDNFTASYVAILNELTLLCDKDQEKLLNILNDNKYLLGYIKHGKQLFAKIFINVLGIKNTSLLLSLRRKIKYRK